MAAAWSFSRPLQESDPTCKKENCSLHTQVSSYFEAVWTFMSLTSTFSSCSQWKSVDMLKWKVVGLLTLLLRRRWGWLLQRKRRTSLGLKAVVVTSCTNSDHPPPHLTEGLHMAQCLSWQLSTPRKKIIMLYFGFEVRKSPGGQRESKWSFARKEENGEGARSCTNPAKNPLSRLWEVQGQRSRFYTTRWWFIFSFRGLVLTGGLYQDWKVNKYL